MFNPCDPHPVQASIESVFGIISLIFWSVTIIVTVTYVLLVMRADNDGEGGIMALITLIRRGRVAPAMLWASRVRIRKPCITGPAGLLIGAPRFELGPSSRLGEFQRVAES